METKTELSLLAIDCVSVIFSASCSDWNIILWIRLLEYATGLVLPLEQQLGLSVEQPERH